MTDFKIVLDISGNVAASMMNNVHEIDGEKRYDLLKYKIEKDIFFDTDSGVTAKSNIVYNILSQCEELNTKFLVIEPAKGEYKNVFGNKFNVDIPNIKLSDHTPVIIYKNAEPSN